MPPTHRDKRSISLSRVRRVCWSCTAMIIWSSHFLSINITSLYVSLSFPQPLSPTTHNFRHTLPTSTTTLSSLSSFTPSPRPCFSLPTSPFSFHCGLLGSAAAVAMETGFFPHVNDCATVGRGSLSTTTTAASGPNLRWHGQYHTHTHTVCQHRHARWQKLTRGYWEKCAHISACTQTHTEPSGPTPQHPPTTAHTLIHIIQSHVPTRGTYSAILHAPLMNARAHAHTSSSLNIQYQSFSPEFCI